jgi:CheY-like chemotaxis protein
MSTSFSNTVLKGLTMLVIDDEPDNVGVVVRLLTLMGAEVLSAENGKEGLEKARANLPGVIFADLSMPVMSGWQMLHEARQDAALQNIPVIALTAHAMSGDRERVLNAGFAGYISKPIDVPVFIPTLITLLQSFPQLAGHFSNTVKEVH